MNAEMWDSSDPEDDFVGFINNDHLDIPDAFVWPKHPGDMHSTARVSNGSQSLYDRHRFTETHTQSEDTWVDIDATAAQQPDDLLAAKIGRERRIAERSRRDARDANNKVVRLEDKLTNACDERDAANELCDELKSATAKVRQFHADQLSITRAEYEASRQEWEESHGFELDAERLRHAAAIAKVELNYQDSLESAGRVCEELRIICEQDRARHEHQIDVASSDWEVRTKETQQHCEYLGAEMEAERLQHAEATVDAEIKYQAQLESSTSQSERFRVYIEEQRSGYEQQIDSADSNHRARIEETRRHCEDLRTEMDEERKKYAKAIADDRATYEKALESNTAHYKTHLQNNEANHVVLLESSKYQQQQQVKVAMLEELRKGSAVTDSLVSDNHNLLNALGEIESELSIQLSVVKQRDAQIESLQGNIVMLELQRSATSPSLEDPNNKDAVEVERLFSELNLAMSDQRRLERTISGLKGQFASAFSSPSNYASVCAHEEDIEFHKAILDEVSARKTHSPCDDCTRHDEEIIDLGMIINGLKYELAAARSEAWQYCSEATEIQNELVRTRQEHSGAWAAERPL